MPDQAELQVRRGALRVAAPEAPVASRAARDEPVRAGAAPVLRSVPHGHGAWRRGRGALACCGALLALLGAGRAGAAFVEPGSEGNLLVLRVTNTDPQLPLVAVFRYAHVPSWVPRAVPDAQTTLPGRLMPGASGDASFVFDVSPSVLPGTSDSLVVILERNPDDTLRVSVPLEVVAPMLLPHAVRVVLRADFASGYLPPGGALVEALVDGATGVPLHDDGIAPDVAAADRMYTGERLHAAGDPARHRYALALDGEPECDSLLSGDLRLYVVDAFFDDASNPQILPAAEFGVCATTDVSPGAALLPFRLHTAPNPFASFARISFRVPRSGRVTLLFHDVAGRRVRTLPLGIVVHGEQVATWDGRDDDGRALRPGAYLCSLELNGERLGARRLVIVR